MSLFEQQVTTLTNKFHEAKVTGATDLANILKTFLNDGGPAVLTNTQLTLIIDRALDSYELHTRRQMR